MFLEFYSDYLKSLVDDTVDAENPSNQDLIKTAPIYSSIRIDTLYPVYLFFKRKLIGIYGCIRALDTVNHFSSLTKRKITILQICRSAT